MERYRKIKPLKIYSGARQMQSSLRSLRVDQVGSLVNPQYLIDAYRKFEAGRIDEQELATVQDHAVRHVVLAQEKLGFPIISDGEMRRRNFQDNFSNSVSGFDVPKHISYEKSLSGINAQPLARAEQNFEGHGPAIVMRRRALAPIQLVKNIPFDEFNFASKLTKVPVKATILSADRIIQRFDYDGSRAVYKRREDFLADVIKLSREMVKSLISAGCRYIQIDAPGYTAYVDEISIERMRRRGEDPKQNLAMSIAADNAVIEGFDNVVFGIHICRGNARTRDPITGQVVAQFHREGAYDEIADELFNSLNHHRWLLEYDSRRAGSFDPLKYFPKQKIAVLGLVSTKSSVIESADLIKNQIDRASKFINIDQLGLSPQCGFGGFGHETITEDEQWSKLEQIMKAANAIWGRLH